jgi:hypothetical protein
MQRLWTSERSSVTGEDVVDSEYRTRHQRLGQIVGGLVVARNTVKAAFVGGVFSLVAETVDQFWLPSISGAERDFAAGAAIGIIVLMVETAHTAAIHRAKASQPECPMLPVTPGIEPGSFAPTIDVAATAPPLDLGSHPPQQEF